MSHTSFDVVSKIQFIIVDDCSPVKYEIENYNLNITWLRITDDIPWNQGGARNLGVTHAKSDKIIITDLDHILPEETLKHLVKKSNPGRDFFKIYRKDSTVRYTKVTQIFSLCLAPALYASLVMMKSTLEDMVVRITDLLNFINITVHANVISLRSLFATRES